MEQPLRKWEEPDNIPGNSESKPLGKSDLKALEGGGESTARQTDHLKSVARENPNLLESDYGRDSQPAAMHEATVGRGYTENKKASSLFGKISGLSRKKKILFGVGAGSGIIGLIAAMFLAFLPLELIHIKNFFYKEVGGVQSRTYQLGRERYYSRMFFFDKEGNFSGYKNTGIRGMMYQNRQTKKMVQALESNGYKIEFEKINDEETGRIKALHRVDRQGKIIPGQSISSNGDLQRAWSVRSSGVLPEVLRTVYPDETARWHGKMARKLYKRWGLTRTNWVGDYLRQKSGVTALENKELALRGALRQHLFGNTTKNTTLKPSGVTEEETNNTDEAVAENAKRAIVNDDLAKDVIEKAGPLAEAQLADLAADNPSSTLDLIEDGARKNLSAGQIADNLSRGVGESIFKSLNALGSAQIACSGKAALDSVVIGARVLRSAQLMKFGLSVLNIADAMQNGEAVSSKDVDIMMTYLNSKDEQGRTMFASSGWRYWAQEDNSKFSFSNFDKDERNKYSVGGGFTGTLGGVAATLDSKISTPCSTVNSTFANIGGFVVGIGAGIFTGGGFTVVNAALNLGVNVAANVAMSVATEMLTPIVAGTVVNGAEKGTAVGNALVSGMEVLSNANAANAGMRPLKTDEFLAAQGEYDRYRQAQMANLNFRDRLFSTHNEDSLVMTASMKLSTLNLTGVLENPLRSVASAFSSINIFGRTVSAAPINTDCIDPEISSSELAATPFCNLQLGIPEAMINDPEYFPDVVDQKMIDGGYVDADGNAVEGKGYDSYLQQCTSDQESPGGQDFRSIDIIHKYSEDGGSSQTDECSATPLFNMYRFYSYIGQTENDGLTGSNISDAGPPAPSNAGTASQDVLTGSSQEIAKQILAAANEGKIKFNILDKFDTTDNSTPEANIRQVSNGQAAITTTTCGGERGAKPPNKTTSLDTNLLKFILEVSQGQNIQINSLAGQCHKNPTSNHYKGTAVDFNCPFNAQLADPIGAKYGITSNPDETCSTDPPHYHYSVGGN